jgi:fused
MGGVARPLAILAKMVGYRPLAVQLLKEGLLNPTRVAALLEGPIAKETLLDFLMIISDLARMSKVCHILACLQLYLISSKSVILWCPGIVG